MASMYIHYIQDRWRMMCIHCSEICKVYNEFFRGPLTSGSKLLYNCRVTLIFIIPWEPLMGNK